MLNDKFDDRFVSCVEQGRWRYRSKFFGLSGSQSPMTLRRTLKASVNKSVKETREHRSDQGEIWKQVTALNATHQVVSGTAAMSDAFTAHQNRHAEFRERLKPVDGANGMAVAVGPRIMAVDFFDKASTCRKMWDRLLSRIFFDAMEGGEVGAFATVAEVENLLRAASDLNWEEAQSVGEGEEFRTESPKGDIASVLVFEGAVLHGSVVTAV